MAEIGHHPTGGDSGAEGGVGPEGFDGLVGVGALREAGTAEEGVGDLEDMLLQGRLGALALIEGEDVFFPGVGAVTVYDLLHQRLLLHLTQRDRKRSIRFLLLPLLLCGLCVRFGIGVAA